MTTFGAPVVAKQHACSSSWTHSSYITTVRSMAQQPNQPRRQWGSVKDPARLGWRVKLANKEYLDHLAQESGLSGAAVFDLMVEHLRAQPGHLTPDWLPQTSDIDTRDAAAQGALPIE